MSLRLRLVLASGACSALAIDEAATYPALLAAVASTFGVDEADIEALLFQSAGFPLRYQLLTPPGDATAVAALGVRGNTTMQVLLVPASRQRGKKPTVGAAGHRLGGEDDDAIEVIEEESAEDESAVAGCTRPKRAAAAAAAENITAMISADAQLLKQKRATAAAHAAAALAKTKKKASGAAPTVSSSRVVSLFGPVQGAAPSAGSAKRKFGSLSGLRQRQQEQAAEQQRSAGPAKRRRVVLLRGRGGEHGVEDGFGADLAAAVSGPAASLCGDPTLQYLRAGARLAVARQYEVADAADRLAATLSGAYAMEPVLLTRVVGSGVATSLRVRFLRPGRRVWDEETVPNLPAAVALALLKGVLAAAAGGDDASRENLKPHLMALISPHQFWAVVRYGGALLRQAAGASAAAAAAATAGAAAVVRSSSAAVPASSSCSAAGPGAQVALPPQPSDWLNPNRGVVEGSPVDVEAALRALVPGADWAFLTVRAKRQTEKAAAAAAAAACARLEREASRAKRNGLPLPAGNAAAAVVVVDDAPSGSSAAAAAAAPQAAALPTSLAAGPSSLLVEALHMHCRHWAPPATVTLQLRQLQKLAASITVSAPVAGAATAAVPAGASNPCAWLLQCAMRIAAATLTDASNVDECIDFAAAVDGQDLSDAIGGSAACALLPPGALPPLKQLIDGAAAAAASETAAGERADALPSSLTVLCDACGRARVVWAREADLSALADNDAVPWTCSGSGLSRLASRGGCDAPDDDLCRMLGDGSAGEASAACCTRAGLTSVVDVASAHMPDDSDVLFTGPEGDLGQLLQACKDGSGRSALGAELEAAAGAVLDGLTHVESADAAVSPLPLSFRMLQRVPVPVLLFGHTAAAVVASAAAVAPAVPDADSVDVSHVAASLLRCPAETNLMYRRRGYQLMHAAASLVIAASSPGHSAVAVCESAASAVPSSASAAPPATVGGGGCCEEEKPWMRAAALLRCPMGWLLCKRVASAWQSCCRGDVMAERMVAILAGPDEDEVGAEGFSSVDPEDTAALLESLRVCTPMDLLGMDPDVLLSGVYKAWRGSTGGASTGADGSSNASPFSGADVSRWRLRAQACREEESWLDNCVSS